MNVAQLYTKFVDLIGRDINSESESKGLIVLIRIQTIMDFLYNVAMAIICYTCFNAISGIFATAFAALHIYILVLTYKHSTRRALFLYCILVALTTIFYCQYLSAGLGFRYVIFSAIPLIYFKTDESWSFRISWSSLAVVFSICLAIAGLVLPPTWIIPLPLKIIIVILTTFVLAGKLMVISHFYYKKFASDEVKIIKYTQKLEKLSTQDALTLLQNRRGMENHLEKRIAEAIDTHTTFSIAIADIDFFKKVNDTFGHEAGDYVLKRVSEVMSQYMEEKGHLARWGGEEFLLEFNTNGDDAYVQVEDLRHLIEQTSFEYEGTPIKVTMTFGLEEYSYSYPLKETIDKADQKLYIGKESGRNKVVY